MIDSREFLAAKRRSETEPMLPTGTRIAFTSGPAYQDHNRIWAVLDKVLAKYPDVVLRIQTEKGATRFIELLRHAPSPSVVGMS